MFCDGRLKFEAQVGRVTALQIVVTMFAKPTGLERA